MSTPRSAARSASTRAVSRSSEVPLRSMAAKEDLGLPFWNTNQSALNASAALANSDASGAVSFAERANHHGVAVFQEAARLARRERERLGAAPGALQEVARRITACAGHRPAGDEISRAQVAPVGGVVREHLRKSPVHAGK